MKFLKFTKRNKIAYVSFTRGESLNALNKKTLEESILDLQERTQATIDSIDSKDYTDLYIKKQFSVKDNPNFPMFKTGTKGILGELYADFGGGTLAMLHGKEAVIPEKSTEGKILKEYESGKLLDYKPEKSNKVENSLQYLVRSWPIIVELISVQRRLSEFESKL